MKQFILSALLTVFLLGSFASAQTDDISQEVELSQAEYDLLVSEFMETLAPQTGTIDVSGIPATVSVPAGLVYYSKDDTKRVLEDLWGNAPGYDQVGMLAPEGGNFGDPETWAAILSFEKTGYVSDDDARDIDYSDLLRTLKKNTAAESKQNAAAGYPTLELVGWAKDPSYDANTHRLYWAKELVFDGYTDDPTLNYDMRILGRRGVLSINFVSNMSQIEAIEQAAPQVLEAPNFNEGEAYSDYKAGDKKAGYGIAALIAGGAGVAAIKKGGLMAILLVFLKKGWILLFAFGAVVWRGMKRMFRKA